MLGGHRDPRGMVRGGGGYVLLDAHAGQPTGRALSFIPAEKTADLLAIKQSMGLPDVRMDMKECQLCDLPEQAGRSPSPPTPARSAPPEPPATAEDIEAIVQGVTSAVMASLEAKKR